MRWSGRLQLSPSPRQKALVLCVARRIGFAGTAKHPYQWARLRRSEASRDLSAATAYKAREIDGIGNGIKQIGPMESGVNTSDGGCY